MTGRKCRRRKFIRLWHKKQEILESIFPLLTSFLGHIGTAKLNCVSRSLCQKTKTQLKKCREEIESYWNPSETLSCQEAISRLLADDTLGFVSDYDEMQCGIFQNCCHWMMLEVEADYASHDEIIVCKIEYYMNGGLVKVSSSEFRNIPF